MSIEEALSSDARLILDHLRSKISIDEKLRLFKDFCEGIDKKYKETHGRVNSDDDGLKDLLLLHFLLESRHPVKNLIQKIFESGKYQALNGLFCDFLKDRLNEAMPDDCYKLITYINDLSQNFDIGISVICNSICLLLPFMNSLIQNINEELNKNQSPSKKNEASQYLHNCFQAYLFCVSSCVKFIEAKDRLKCMEYIQMLNEICSGIFESKEIRIETKNILSMIITIRSSFMCEFDDIYEIIRNSDYNLDKRFCFMAAIIQQDSNISEMDEFCNILNTTYYNNSTDNGSVYTILKLFMQMIKKLSSCNGSEYSGCVIINVKEIVFLNIQHNVEAIRYLSRDIIKATLELLKEDQSFVNRKLMAQIFEKISNLPIDLKASIIFSIHTIISVTKMLEKVPNLLNMILSSICTNKENKIGCYLALCNKSLQEIEFENWYEVFIVPLERKMLENGTSKEENILLSTLLLKCIKKDKRAIQKLLQRRNDFGKRFNFLLLSLANEEGLLSIDPATKALWKGIVSYDEIKNSIIDIDGDVRLSAIHLIVETKKITEEFTNEEIECIMYFFKNNIHLQIASNKQNLIAIIKKVFARIRCSIKNSKKINNELILGVQLNVLLEFHKFALKNICADANYSRRSLSLVLLLYIVEIMAEFYPHQMDNIWNQENFERLFKMLYDSYENNKEKAMEIIGFIPKGIVSKYSRVSLDHLKSLLKSIKPADSVTSSFLLIHYLKYHMDVNNGDDSNAFDLLVWCEELLLQAILKAENSIIVAAGSNPMYGYITSIRKILAILDLNKIRVDGKWKKFFDRLLDMTKRLIKIAAPIVNNPSPEGIYLKENLDVLMNETNTEELTKIFENTTSQMILLCGWRIIKEVSLLFGYLSSNGARICSEPNELLSVKQLIGIGDDFLELLTSIKHRGAFEQCSFGFLQYCIALRTSNCSNLHSLPPKILENILDSLSRKIDNLEHENFMMKNLCATRRSAGLPFIIQSLLASEIKVSKHEKFHYAMKKLLNLAHCGEELETRIHSLNILRVLFRCKDLNDIISEYICEGVKCSILGCGAETWAERNSSTLLFSSLMVRIFGVQRNKDCEQIDIKNKMSSKVFFARYPELYDFFLEQLNQSVEYVGKQEMNQKFYPLLLLLNRLFVSPSEKCESSLRLINFISLVTSCSGCIDMRARILCAKFVSNVLPIDRILIRMYENVHILLHQSHNLPANFKHGRLLETLYLSKKITNDMILSKYDTVMYQVNDLLETIISNDFLKIFIDQKFFFTTILDIILDLMRIIWMGYLTIDFSKIMNCFQHYIPEKESIGSELVQCQLVILELIYTIYLGDGFMAYAFSLKEDRYYSLLTKLNSFILILTDANQRSQVVEEYEIDQRLNYFIEKTNEKTLNEFKLEFNKNHEFLNRLHFLCYHEDIKIRGRSFEILSLLIGLDRETYTNMNQSLITSLTGPDDYKIVILKTTKIWMIKNIEKIGLIDWKIIYSHVESSDSLRLLVLDILKISGDKLWSMTLYSTFYFLRTILNFLVDENTIFCEKASKIVTNITELEQVNIGSYATHHFLKYFFQKSLLKDTEKLLLLIIILFMEEMDDLLSVSEDRNEFQVFDKADSSGGRDYFVLKDFIVSSLKSDVNLREQISTKFWSVNKEIELNVTVEEFNDFYKKLNECD